MRSFTTETSSSTSYLYNHLFSLCDTELQYHFYFQQQSRLSINHLFLKGWFVLSHYLSLILLHSSFLFVIKRKPPSCWTSWKFNPDLHHENGHEHSRRRNVSNFDRRWIYCFSFSLSTRSVWYHTCDPCFHESQKTTLIVGRFWITFFVAAAV